MRLKTTFPFVAPQYRLELEWIDDPHSKSLSFHEAFEYPRVDMRLFIEGREFSLGESSLHEVFGFLTMPGRASAWPSAGPTVFGSYELQCVRSSNQYKIVLNHVVREDEFIEINFSDAEAEAWTVRLLEFWDRISDIVAHSRRKI